MHSEYWQFGGRGRHGGHGGRGGHRGGGRFGGGFGGSRGGGLRAARMLASDDLQLIALALLEEKPRHGYEIIKAVEDHSSGVYKPSPALVYPALTYLEEMGFAVSEAVGNKKLYKITKPGKEHLAKSRKLVDESLEQLARYGRKVARVEKQFADDEAENDFEYEGSRASREEWRSLRAEFRELRDELREAFHETMDLPVEEQKRLIKIVRKALAEIRDR